MDIQWNLMKLSNEKITRTTAHVRYSSHAAFHMALRMKIEQRKEKKKKDFVFAKTN